ncbi:hypothetical protein C8R43DRAFT_945487 [Mycena crocata]|nr:hypothetical protein C8R43DRAFT_945487 [Mycena crocata]
MRWGDPELVLALPRSGWGFEAPGVQVLRRQREREGEGGIDGVVDSRRRTDESDEDDKRLLPQPSCLFTLNSTWIPQRHLISDSTSQKQLVFWLHTLRGFLRAPLGFVAPRATFRHFCASVGAFARLGGLDYFITTNADYIPALPSLEIPHRIFLRSDMRYGTDDPALWPQQWSAHYSHFALIPKKGSRPELDILWWDPSRQDFEFGNAQTRNTGHLRFSRLTPILAVVNTLIGRCEALRRDKPKSAISLFGEYIQNILMWIDQLQSLNTTYEKMVFMLTSVQRACLELEALYLYMHTYQQRMKQWEPASVHAANVGGFMGAFIHDITVAQVMWSAGVPFWLLRPVHIFDNENILRLVDLTEPDIPLNDLRGDGTPPMLECGNTTDEKITAIHRATRSTAWYRDPFDTNPTNTRAKIPVSSAVTVVPNPPAVVSSAVAVVPNPPAIVPNPPAIVASASGSGPPPPNNRHGQGVRFEPYPSASTPEKSGKGKSAKSAKEPAQVERDKYTVLVAPGMPLSIPSWANALANVNQSITPYTSELRDRRYVLPEPALFVNSDAAHNNRRLHHWMLVRDGFHFMLSHPQHTQLLTGQQWRDVLAGQMKERGHAKSKMGRHSTEIQDLIRPALEAAKVTSLEGFPALAGAVPEFSLDRTREIVWQVAETSFRVEFASLDSRASGLDRLKDVKECFAGHTLLFPPLSLSKNGLAAASLEECHRYIAHTARLMLQWRTKSLRPTIISHVAYPAERWSPDKMEKLEDAVSLYYTQAFFEYFGRAAIIPMRLDHDVVDA